MFRLPHRVALAPAFPVLALVPVPVLVEALPVVPGKAYMNARHVRRKLKLKRKKSQLIGKRMWFKT